MITSIGAITPHLAAVYNLLASKAGFKSKTSSSVKINPTFPLISGANEDNYGIGPPCFL